MKYKRIITFTDGREPIEQRDMILDGGLAKLLNYPYNQAVIEVQTDGTEIRWEIQST